MSATQELIAAALTAVDELHDINRVVPIHDRIENQLREACARAMVQPAAPDMAEVGQLLNLYDTAWLFGSSDDLEDSRAALLDYVRGVLAERDALIADNERLSGLYEQAVKGRADMRSALREARAAALQPVFAPTEDQIQRHKIRAGDCPPDSEVLLVRSVRRFAEKAAPQPVGEEPCRIEQPTGWRCTRAGGHEGPCAAVEDRS